MDDDVWTLAQLIHAAVAESDARGGTLSPIKVVRALWPGFPGMAERDAGYACGIAADYRGKGLPHREVVERTNRVR